MWLLVRQEYGCAGPAHGAEVNRLTYTSAIVLEKCSLGNYFVACLEVQYCLVEFVRCMYWFLGNGILGREKGKIWKKKNIM